VNLPSGAAATTETVGLEQGILHLLPTGASLFQKDVQVELPAGESSHVLLHVPAQVNTASIQVLPVGITSGLMVLEWKLRKSEIPEIAAAGLMELSARLMSESSGIYFLRLSFEVNGLKWSGMNACDLPDPASDQLWLSSLLCLQNESHFRFANVSVRLPREQVVSQTVAWALPMFDLDRAITVDPLEQKSITVGRWPVALHLVRYEVRTTLPVNSNPTQCSPANVHLWVQAKSSVDLVWMLRSRSDTAVNEVFLFPGTVKVTSLSSTSMTYTNATHAAVDDRTVELHLPSRDISFGRTQTEHSELLKGHVYQVSMRLNVTNTKDEPVDVDILEPLLECAQAEIVAASSPYTVSHDRILRFSLALALKSQEVITYKVKYAVD
jgi:hypothetical protein